MYKFLSKYKTYLVDDYTNMNIQLIDEYNLDLKIFYLDILKFDKIIEEIPMDKLNVIIDKAGTIIENSKKYKDMTFNIDSIRKFIKFSVETILGELKLLNAL